MKRNDLFSTSYSEFRYAPPQDCGWIFPPRSSGTVLSATTLQYTAISDGIKRIYTDQDGLSEYQSCQIFDPARATLINLFVNGMLQSPNLYRVQLGSLILKTNDVPEKGVPIVLQFVMITS
jgi:hypothetical protein